MEFFAKKVNDFQSLNIFEKSFILVVRLGLNTPLIIPGVGPLITKNSACSAKIMDSNFMHGVALLQICIL